MFEFHVGQDVTVLVGCGLGGTSLINANVVLEPGDPIFADHRWPAELRDHPEVLKPFLPIVMGAVLAPPGAILAQAADLARCRRRLSRRP
jgi:hypothetical protein